MAFFDEFLELLGEGVELGGGDIGAFGVDECGMAGGLSESEEGFEDDHCFMADGGFGISEEGLSVVMSKFVVDFPLCWFHFADDGLFGFVG